MRWMRVELFGNFLYFLVDIDAKRGKKVDIFVKFARELDDDIFLDDTKYRSYCSWYPQSWLGLVGLRINILERIFNRDDF